uniref:Ras association domain-containing protein 8-like n=1 Tax=Phallusia mammillata TaxID=59560 RepID=A0A6F9DR32_9ASCI|nr:ras association domain-containing protein 8-like [Phallusia mammillata]
MELKVWVDGIQRVVCGITEQTTVQEVVIALAQATGRTGRYTLVEQRRNIEKMLPPSEKPLQVLSKLGDASNEIQFVLRRTGASSVSGSDGIITPERSAYRQSLPPQLKHRQKNDALLNRKEPKRKSLTISGLANDNATKQQDKINRNTDKTIENDNEKSKTPVIKKALIPPPLRNNTSANVEPIKEETVVSPSRLKKEALIPPAFRHDEPTGTPTKKKALIPPPLRNDVGKINLSESKTKHFTQPGKFRSKTPDQLHHRRTSSSSATTPVKPRPDSAMATTSSRKMSKSAEAERAKEDFVCLVMEQHNHIKEQSQTLKTITEETEKFQQTMKNKANASANIQNEVEMLEAKIQENEIKLYNEKMLEDQLTKEEEQNSILQNSSNKLQTEISTMNAQIKEIERRLGFLNEEIAKESKLKKREAQNKIINVQRETRTEIQKKTLEMNKLSEEIADVERSLQHKDEESNNQRMQLEVLNRELRQVNLQQFIRQTGSKVTVLPPEDEKETPHSEDQYNPPVSPSKRTQNRPMPVVGSSSDSGGVWV